MNILQNLRSVFFSGFQINQGLVPQLPAVNNGVSYPNQFFNMENLRGTWNEVARTPNSLQPSNDVQAVHEFTPNPSNPQQVRHQINQGQKEITHTLNVDSDDKSLSFTDSKNNFFGSPNKATLIGLYDPGLNLITQPNVQKCAYCLFCQGKNNFWMLARPGFEHNHQAVNHMLNFSQKLGFNPQVTKHRVNNNDESEIDILWNTDEFPADGNGREITIGKNDSLRFRSTDEDLHTVCQADIDEDGIWYPVDEPKIQMPPSEVGFNRALKIGEPGMYYLACPVGKNHRRMRLRINVKDEVDDVLNGMNS
jgi:lipocalin